MLGALKGELSATAVNAPMVAPEVNNHCHISSNIVIASINIAILKQNKNML